MIQDLELEKEILSRLIVEPDLFQEVYGRINSDDFFSENPRIIFNVMKKLFEEKNSWDLFVIRSSVSDPEKFSDIIFNVPESVGISQLKVLIKRLRDLSIKRTLLSMFEETGNRLNDTNSKDLVSNLLHFATNLEVLVHQEKDWKLESLIKSHKLLMEQRYSGKLQGIPTGFQELDIILGQGLQRKDLVIVGARPSIGKTSFSLTVAYNAAKAGYKSLFISCEMDDTEIFDRLLGFHTKIPVTSIIRGSVKKEEIEQAYSELKTLPLSIIHLSKGTSGDVHAIAAKHRTLQGLDLLVVDYLSYLSDYDEESEVLRLGKITKSLKMTANILDCAVLAPHQLSRRIERRSEGKREQPLLSDLRDSGHIEQDSDVVLFLNRDLLGEEGGARTTLRIGKNRTGQVGIIDLKFDKETTMFQEI